MVETQSIGFLIVCADDVFDLTGDKPCVVRLLLVGTDIVTVVIIDRSRPVQSRWDRSPCQSGNSTVRIFRGSTG